MSFRHKFPLFIVPAVFLAAAASVSSEESWKLASPSTLDGYFREALRNHPELAAEFARVTASKQVGTQVGGLPDPRITYTDFVSQVQTRTGPQERTVMLSQAFPWPGKLSLRENIADREAEAAFYRYEGLQRRLVRDVGLAYFDYALLGITTSLTKKNVELLEQLVPAVDAKTRGGGDLGATLRLEVELNRVKDQLQGLSAQRQAHSSRLQRLIGSSPDLEKILPWPELPEQAPGIGDTDHLEKAVDTHPLIVAAETGVISAELAEDLSKKSPLPDLNIGANVIDIGDGGETGVGLMIGVSLPLDFDKYRAEREEKRALSEAASANVENLKQGLRSDLHGTIQAYREASKRIDLYREKLLPAAEQALELTEESYRNDKASLTDLIDAERTLLDLQLMNQKALAVANKSALEIRTLTAPLANFEK